jgi:hypothetical protein
METSPELPFVYFLFIFIGLWVSISYFVSLAGGWWTLSKTYRFRGKFIGKKYHMRSIGMRSMAGYGFCVNIGVNPDGLYFSLSPLYRLAHPPFFIPWSDIHSIEETKDMFILKFYKIRFRLNPDIPIFIGKRLGNKIFKDYKNKIPAISMLTTKTRNLNSNKQA